MNPIFKEFEINRINVLSIYEYNDVIKEKLFLFKGCKDYELKDIFIKPFFRELSLLFKNYIFIPMPSYHLNDEERGFNHVVEMFGCFDKSIHPILIKTSNIKQANLSSEERASIGKFIQLKEDIDSSFYQNKKICLIDDVCTTGSTLKRALEIIETFNPKRIKILVMASTIFEKNEENKNKVFI